MTQASKDLGVGAPLAVVILAAGKGTRMKSRRPKVLHELCGRPMLGHILSAASALGSQRLIVVVGCGAEEVEASFSGRAEFVLQAEQQGTGHAVLQTSPKLRDFEGEVLVLYGDTPLIRSETLERMRALKRESGAALIMLTSPEPLPGLIVRDASASVLRVVEATDATPEELTIREGNTGVYLVDSGLLWEALAKVDGSNAQGEIYLPDIVAYAVQKGFGLEALLLEDAEECLGVNSRSELARASSVMRRRINEHWMSQGVSIVDPAATYIDADAVIGRDSLIEPGCVIQGDSVLGEAVHLKPQCTIESSRVDADTVIGPNAHLRPGTHLMEGCRIGNFVELKNSTLGPGCKADHLSYVGDADVGARSSFGCGAIVVNYDWNAKHRTKIGEDCTIGCNVNLVAPIVIADRVSVAAGSTLTHDVPEDALAVARARQRNVEGWRARRDGRARPEAAAKPGESAKARTAPATAATNKGPRTASAASGKAAPRAASSKSAKKRTAKAAKTAKKAARKKSAKRATRKKR